MARRARRHARGERGAVLQQMPYCQLKTPYRPIEVLDEEQVELIHETSMRILEQVGLRVMDRPARDAFAAAGFEVDHSSERVRFDRDGVLDLVAKAPSSFTVRGRDPLKKVRCGDGYLAFTSVGGPPFASDLARGRRSGSYDDFLAYLKLTQMLNIIHIEGGCSIDPSDLPPETRHLDIYAAAIRHVDKPWKPQMVGTARARDAIEMACIALDTDREGLAADPVFFANTNTNTPLVLDDEIAQGIMEMAAAGQPVCITPFALSGAMAPVTLAGALALQNAEALAGVALVQIVRPGCPACYGSFTSNVDMRTGSPAFGTPEYTKAAQASGQLARRYGLPWRSSNTNASCAPDAQAAYESEMSIWGAITGQVSVLNQGAGWLEGGLVASFEKLILDAEMLQMMAAWLDPLVVDEKTLALDAVIEVGPGGHFFGAKHTLERYERAFYAPLVSDWRNFETWEESGSPDAARRAHRLWQEMLAVYEAPPLDSAIDEAITAYVTKRKEEIGSGDE